MKSFSKVRQDIKNAVVSKVTRIPEIVSLTFVGSFEYADSLSSISDIDIVIIVDKLNEPLFQRIVNGFAEIDAGDCGLSGYAIKLNTTFGPLKFDDKKTIIFHVMVYDMDAHRKHVNESPFTCFDWEYQSAQLGKNLKDIYPVNTLQLDDLIGTRRGLDNYLQDIEEGSISYREYVFSENGYSEQKKQHLLDNKHRKEYAYHIIKFIMVNSLKIFTQKNFKADNLSIADRFGSLYEKFAPHTVFFIELSNWKLNNAPEPADIFPRLQNFISQVGQWLNELSTSMPKLVVYRHAKTGLNDGSFLGSRRNPSILEVATIPEKRHFDRLLTGTLNRTIETGHFFSATTTSEDPLLNEIDYGLAEGLTIDKLGLQFPEIIAGWAEGEDIRFPEGENQQDVLARIENVLNRHLHSLPASTAFVTHNVVLRVLIAKTHHIPLTSCYLLSPGYLESFSFSIFNNTLIPELTAEQRISIRDKISRWKT